MHTVSKLCAFWFFVKRYLKNIQNLLNNQQYRTSVEMWIKKWMQNNSIGYVIQQLLELFHFQ